MSDECKPYGYWLIIITASWFVIWSFLPVLFLGNAYIDVLENIVWAQHFQFGYDKNPYFGAWLTRVCYFLTGGGTWFSYLLSQISVAMALICVWLLSTHILPRVSLAFISVVFLMLIPFYSSSATEFNDDVMEISLWALTVYFFYRAVMQQRRLDWVLVGLFAGLSFMTKYYGVVLFGSMAFFLLFDAKARKSFSRSGIYYCAAVFLLLSIPNMIWLMQNDMVSISYALHRAKVDEDSSWVNHIVNPAKLLSRAGEILAAAAGVFLVIFFKREKQRFSLPVPTRNFLWIMGLGPLVLTLVFAAFSGGSIRFTWMTPCFSLLGLFLVALWQPVITPLRIKLLVSAVGVFAIICIVGFTYKAAYESPFDRRQCRYEAFPGYAISQELTGLWRSRYNGVPIKYVVGDRREACNISVYAPDQPDAYFKADPVQSPWIDETDIERHGALLVWEGPVEKRPEWMERLAQKFSDRIVFNPSRDYSRATRSWLINLFGEPKKITISSAFITPEKMVCSPTERSATVTLK